MPLNPHAASFVPFDRPPVIASPGSHIVHTPTPEVKKKKKPNRRRRNGKGGNKSQNEAHKEQDSENIEDAQASTAEHPSLGGKKKQKAKQKRPKRQKEQRNNRREDDEPQYAKDYHPNDSANVAEEDHTTTFLAEAHEFPTLGSTDKRNDDGVPTGAQPEAGAWVDAAVSKSLVYPVQATTTTSEDEQLSLIETSTGLRLTLLGKQHESSTTSSPDVVARRQPGTPSEQNVGEAHDNNKQSPLPSKEEENPVRLSTPRINMTKLRDKLWDALREQKQRLERQKEVEEQRQMLLLQQQKEEAAEEQESSTEEEYVETQSLAFSTGGLAKARQADAIGMEANDQIKEYLKFSHPVHCAIVNHDREALEALAHFPGSHWTRQQQECNIKKKPMRRDVTRLSPIQLAVKLDKPDLLRILLRGAAARQEQARRNGNKAKGEEEGDEYPMLPTPLMMAVQLRHEECVQAILDQSGSSASVLIGTRDSSGNNALHCCCGANDKTGAREAGTPLILRSLLAVILAAGGTVPSKVLPAKNQNGQTAFHLACQQGRVELVEVFLDNCGSGSCFSVFVKLFSMTDKQQQTPLLAAVASGSTNLVMALLSWQSNHHQHHIRTKQRQKASNVSITSSRHASKTGETSTCCPLVWAIKTSASVDVVRLLLEFHTPTLFSRSTDDGQGYDLTLALHEAVIRSASLIEPSNSADVGEELLEIIRSLIENGANPCEVKDLEDTFSNRAASKAAKTSNKQTTKAATAVVSKEDGAVVRPSTIRASGASALAVAAALGHNQTIVTLLDALMSQRKRVKESRRQDPTLRKQPESFFRGLESMEEKEMQDALSDALVTSLFLGHKNDASRSNNPLDVLSSRSSRQAVSVATGEDYLSCGHSLFLKGAQLGSAGLARLKCSLGGDGSILRRPDEVLFGTTTASSVCHCYDFRSGYTREAIAVNAFGAKRKLAMRDRSEMLDRMPWMEDQLEETDPCRCEWLNELSSRTTKSRTEQTKNDSLFQELQSDLVALVTESGKERILAHASIISQQSAKLEAAIRFAKMSHDGPSSSKRELLEIDLGSTPTRLCLLMLQHLYHGSIACGLPDDPTKCCEDLLDLLLLSEEFLSVSLMQECEMRLLSDDPWKCFCWSCNRATTASVVPSSDNKQIDECVVLVNGPPKLLTASTVIDVVAVSQHLEETRLSMPDGEAYTLDFAIRLGGGRDDQAKEQAQKTASREWTRLPTTRALAGLREVSTNIIMSQFLATLESNAYASQLEDGLEEGANGKREAAILLLRMCLEEFAASDFREAWFTLQAKRVVNLSSPSTRQGTESA